jgi:hypothetical protein
MTIFGKYRGLELTIPQVTVKCYHSFLVMDKCVSVTHNVKVHTLESICDIMC